MPWVRAKAWFRSRTMWVSLLTIIAGAVEIATEQPVFAEHAGALLAFLGGISALLRILTDQPLSTNPLKDDGAAVQAGPNEVGP